MYPGIKPEFLGLPEYASKMSKFPVIFDPRKNDWDFLFFLEFKKPIGNPRMWYRSVGVGED